MLADLPEDFENQERQPDFARDIAALVLVALTLITTLSVVTRDPADPVGNPIWPISAVYTPDQVVYPQNETIANACGYWGALLSSLLFDSIGIGSAVLIAGVGGLSTALLLRGKVNAPVLRSLGGSIVLLAFTSAASLFPFQPDGMPVVGSGGYLGAMTSSWLLDHFAPVGDDVTS